jgi:hypothetical protein
MQEGNGSWLEYRRLVMDALDKTTRELNSINRRLGRIESEIAQLQVKSGVWGAVAGAVVTIALLLLGLAGKVASL